MSTSKLVEPPGVRWRASAHHPWASSWAVLAVVALGFAMGLDLGVLPFSEQVTDWSLPALFAVLAPTCFIGHFLLLTLYCERRGWPEIANTRPSGRRRFSTDWALPNLLEGWSWAQRPYFACVYLTGARLPCGIHRPLVARNYSSHDPLASQRVGVCSSEWILWPPTWMCRDQNWSPEHTES
jgi:hypothetical protein